MLILVLTINNDGDFEIEESTVIENTGEMFTIVDYIFYLILTFLTRFYRLKITQDF